MTKGGFMIYFDNAATGGFKPYSVIDFAQTTIRFLSANPGRSAHRLSVNGMQTIVNTRNAFADYFSCNSDRVIFTKNCTESLNLAIFGTLKNGGHVITTVFEHNSVLRPLTALKEKGLISLDIVSPYDQKDLTACIKEKIKDNTYMIVCTAVSNVTGFELPIAEIGALAKEKGLIFLVDGAQGGGHIHLDMKEQNISMLCLAGHKGLCGIMTSGVLLFDESVDVEPLIFGGTGSESFNLSQPTCYPDRLESGTLSLPAIGSLLEGLKYIKANRKNFAGHLYLTTEKLINALNEIEGITTYSKPNQSGIVAFAVKDISSEQVADILNKDYDIAVRGGLHCAPLMHKFLDTLDSGLVRVSLAVQNSSKEIAFFLSAIKDIVKNKKEW